MVSFSPLPSLPEYPGPLNVGSTEYEIPIAEIDSKSSPPDDRISTIKFRLFYPTDATARTQPITWVPSPQKQWTQAFSSFLGASLGWSSLVNPVLSVLNFITIPAKAEAPLRREPGSARWPLAIFSHGLAGNYNMYSAICGTLASCGVVCAAIEHRDGSSPVSWIRGPGGKIQSEISYRKYAHAPSADVLNARNTQLRIRLWELDMLYLALRKLNQGEALSNYALENPYTAPSLSSSLDMAPGRVSWVGHSFGAATITQFVKSVYYHDSRPSYPRSRDTGEHDWTPLYSASDSNVAEQITPSSPIALLDVWTLPFRAPSSQWLWEKPFPCYDRSASSSQVPNTVAIMSTEFYNYADLRRRTQALLSPDPIKAQKQLAREASTSTDNERPLSSPTIATPPNKGDPEPPGEDLEADVLPPPALDENDSFPSALSTHSQFSSRDPSPDSIPYSRATTTSVSLASSRTSLFSITSSSNISISSNPQTPKPNYLPIPPTHSPSSLAPKIFHIPFSAHLSQSDFGLLFPRLTRILMKAIDPEGTIKLNIRGITAAMRATGLSVRRVDEKDVLRTKKAEEERKRREESGWWGVGRWGRKESVDSNVKEAEVDVDEDRILSGDVEGSSKERWVELNLVF